MISRKSTNYEIYISTEISTTKFGKLQKKKKNQMFYKEI